VGEEVMIFLDVTMQDEKDSELAMKLAQSVAVAFVEEIAAHNISFPNATFVLLSAAGILCGACEHVGAFNNKDWRDQAKAILDSGITIGKGE
jgi:hypothetical protein